MKPDLFIIKDEWLEDFSKRRLRFAVIDSDKTGGYPLNFLCMLPLQLAREYQSKFVRIFGDRSREVARTLLTEALKEGADADVKAEIQRRLSLLEPLALKQVKCRGCGRLFHPRRIRRFGSNFCEECMKKRFGSRE